MPKCTVSDFTVMLRKSTPSPVSEVPKSLTFDVSSWEHFSTTSCSMMCEHKGYGTTRELSGFRETKRTILWVAGLSSYPDKFDPAKCIYIEPQITDHVDQMFRNFDFDAIIKDTGLPSNDNVAARILLGELLHSWVGDRPIPLLPIKRYTNSGAILGEYGFKIYPLMVSSTKDQVDIQANSNRFANVWMDYTPLAKVYPYGYTLGEKSFPLKIVLSKGRQSNTESKQSDYSKKGSSLSSHDQNEDANLER